MTKKFLLISIIALAVIVILASCQRSASQAPVLPTSTKTGGLVALPTNGLNNIQMAGTQTQLALVGSATPVGAGSTLIPTSTPFGTPPSLTVVPPTGGTGTPIVISTPVPGTTPIVIVPTATPGIPLTYTLMKGEYPWCIARRFNVDQNELLQINGITSTGQIVQPGMVLQIPQTGDPFIGNRTLIPHPTSYTVPSTDATIYSIACDFGDVDPNAIIFANNLTSPYTLHINQVLYIP